MPEAAIRVVQYGVGVMGSRIARLCVSKGLRLAGAIDIDPAKVGRDLGDVIGIAPLGVKVTNDPASLFGGKIADVAIHAAPYNPERIVKEVIPALRAGVNVISIAGISFLPRQFPDLAAQLDRAAKAAGVTVLGTGLNPGFMQDVMPIVLSGACERVKKISSLRVADFSPWGPDVMRHYGIGFSEEAFSRGVAAGTIGLHQEICQSVDMIAYGLGWELERIEQERIPIVSRSTRNAPHVRIQKDTVCGFRHRALGFHKAEVVIELELCGIVQPDPASDRVQVGTVVNIDGTPNIRVSLQGDLGRAEGAYAATAARAVNAVPHVLRAPAGLAFLPDLPIIGCWQGHV